jgi:hypothetical protein
MKEKEGPSWLFWAHSGPKFKARNGEMMPVVTCLNTPFICEDVDQVIDQKVAVYRNTWELLKLSPLEIKGIGEGACPAPDKKDAAASVSEYKIGAKLCFSVDVLRKTPRDVIRAQVASILAHEMTHLIGLGEEMAEGVQNAVYASFSVAAIDEIKRIRSSIMSQFFFARADLDQVARGVVGENADLVVMGLLGSFHGRLFMLQDILPVGLVKEPSLAVNPENWREVKNALDAPWQRMYALQMDIIEGKVSQQQQMEQATIALRELAKAEKLVADFLGEEVSR